MSRGHIRKRGKSWTVVVEREPDLVTGKRRQKWVGGIATKKDAEEVLTRLLREQDLGTNLDASKMTTGEYLARWLETVARGRLESSSYESYERVIRLHIAPRLGHVKLAKLTRAQLSRLYADLLDSGLAAKTVRHCHSLLHTALKQAERWRMVPRNVAVLVQPPKVRRRRRAVWDAEQAAAFLDSIRGDRLEALYHLAIATGMRRGEVLALRWGDVDLPAGVVRVQQGLVKVKGGSAMRTTKTPKGRRQVALPSAAVEQLRAHRVRQLEERLRLGGLWEEHDLVFPGPTGKPLPISTFDAQWHRALASSGLPPIRFHDLRHSHATLMLRLGVHPKVVSERLGHANVSITLDTYSHATPDMQREAADAFDAALRQAREADDERDERAQ